MANDIRPLRDFTDEEAQEFHQAAVQSFFLYVAVAFVAHLLVWAWRPFWPPEKGYRLEDFAPEEIRTDSFYSDFLPTTSWNSVTEGANQLAAQLSTVVHNIAPFAG